MKKLLLPLLLIALGGGVYFFYLRPQSEEAAPAAAQPAAAATPPAASTQAAPPPPQAVAATEQPAEDGLVDCPICHGAGKMKCPNPNCKDGKVDCPGPCLKLSVGHWVHMDVAGHDPKELWRKFEYPGGMEAWNQNHVGEVIEYRNGEPENVGKCPVCHGAAKIDCPTCHGAGIVTCTYCSGRGKMSKTRALFVTAQAGQAPAETEAMPAPSSTPNSNPDPNPSRPPMAAKTPPPPAKWDSIHLKSGRTITGKVFIVDDEMTWIRTPSGETVKVKNGDVATQP